VASAQKFEVSGIVRQDEASAETDGRGDHKCVDSQFTPSVSFRKEVAGVAGDEPPVVTTGDKPLGEHPIN
jgi:hypothetical protein